MRALRIHEYGGPEAMRLEEVPVPAPGPGDLLVRVAAATINPIDWKIRSGLLRSVFRLEFPRTLGRDCAGVVAAIGPATAGATVGAAAGAAAGASAGGGQGLPAVGQRVVAIAPPGGDGTHAEYVVAPVAQAAVVPEGVGDAEAAACGVAGMSAYIPLVELAAVKAGDRVLVHAAAGGVGSFAVQIAKRAGAYLIGTANAANAEFVRGLGADEVIDYRREDFVARARGCDIVLDSVGGETYLRSLDALKPGGVIVNLAAAPIPPHPANPLVRELAVRVTYTPAKLSVLLGWVAQGEIRPAIAQRFALTDFAAAYQASERGGSAGKLVLQP